MCNVLIKGIIEYENLQNSISFFEFNGYLVYEKTHNLLHAKVIIEDNDPFFILNHSYNCKKIYCKITSKKYKYLYSNNIQLETIQTKNYSQHVLDLKINSCFFSKKEINNFHELKVKEINLEVPSLLNILNHLPYTYQDSCDITTLSVPLFQEYNLIDSNELKINFNIQTIRVMRLENITINFIPTLKIIFFHDNNKEANDIYNKIRIFLSLITLKNYPIGEIIFKDNEGNNIIYYDKNNNYHQTCDRKLKITREVLQNGINNILSLDNTLVHIIKLYLDVQMSSSISHRYTQLCSIIEMILNFNHIKRKRYRQKVKYITENISSQYLKTILDEDIESFAKKIAQTRNFFVHGNITQQASRFVILDDNEQKEYLFILNKIIHRYFEELLGICE